MNAENGQIRHKKVLGAKLLDESGFHDETQLPQILERIKKIEGRFPEEAKLENVASINDALLSERIDQLSKQVENLDKKMLSHWDVALVISTIIAGIIMIVGITYGVLKVIGIIS